MSQDQLPQDADVEEINATLSGGLKSCRAVVANYRTMLGAEANENLPEQQTANDKAPDGTDGPAESV